MMNVIMRDCVYVCLFILCVSLMLSICNFNICFIVRNQDINSEEEYDYIFLYFLRSIIIFAMRKKS